MKSETGGLNTKYMIFHAVSVIPFPIELVTSIFSLFCQPAPVVRIASVGSDLDIRSLAPLTNPTIVFHMGGLLLLIHGD